MLGDFNETISVLWARLLAETLREHCREPFGLWSVMGQLVYM